MLEYWIQMLLNKYQDIVLINDDQMPLFMYVYTVKSLI